MIIRYAEEKNFIELRQFYDGMCKVLSEKDFLPEGDKGGFPPDEMIKDAIKERNQFIGIEDGRIIAAYIMNLANVFVKSLFIDFPIFFGGKRAH